jgi:hypothetical protein
MGSRFARGDKALVPLPTIGAIGFSWDGSDALESTTASPTPPELDTGITGALSLGDPPLLVWFPTIPEISGLLSTAVSNGLGFSYHWDEPKGACPVPGKFCVAVSAIRVSPGPGKYPPSLPYGAPT